LVTKIHIIHVGNMNNKGTQALLSSDVSTLREIINDDVSISVSTTGVDGVKKLGLPLSAVLPTLLDVPYEKADQMTKRLGVSRNSLKYKVFAIAALFLMIVQTLLTSISASLVRIGLTVPYRKEVFHRIRESDVVISCSDENFKETASLLPLNVYWLFTWWSMLFERTIEVLVAKSFNKPVVMFPNSVGPFRTWVGRFLSKLALNNCSSVIIRDPISYRIVKSIGIKSKMFLTSDMALLFKPETKTVQEITEHPVIGVCPGVYSFSIPMQQIKKYIAEHAVALDAAVEKHGFHVLFLPHYISGFAYDDLEISKFILENMKHRENARILRINDLSEFKLLINQVDLLISSKMHPAVLAVSGHVPSIAIVYDHKQTGFFRDLGMSEYTLRLQETSGSELLSRIDKVWLEREKIKKLLGVRVPVLQDAVKKTVKTVMEPFVRCK